MLIDSLEWLGHSGFRIRTREGVIYIDPYRVKDGPEADLILITHGHYDHFSPQDVERLSSDRTWLVGPPAVAERVSGQVHSIAPGELLEDELVRGVHVGAVAAYNTSKRDPDGKVFHPRDAGGGGLVAHPRRGGGWLRAERGGRAALPLGRHRRDPRDGPGHRRRRGAAAGQRRVR